MRRSILVLLTAWCVLSAHTAFSQKRVISSLGRIEPAGGVVQLAGPSGLGSVIVELKISEGDWVDKDQVIAILDSYAVRAAEVERQQAEVDNLAQQLARETKLGKQGLASSAAKIAGLELQLKSAQAALSAARAMLELSIVRAPDRAQVLFVHSHPGERVGVNGIVEIGRTDKMYVIAEVYETDIVHIEPGQRATISSPALSRDTTGVVEKVGFKVGRIDVLGVDPVAEADARVIEVDILLDEPDLVNRLTNLQVEVQITP